MIFCKAILAAFPLCSAMPFENDVHCDWSTILPGSAASAGPLTASIEMGNSHVDLVITGEDADCYLGFLASTPNEWDLPCAADLNNDNAVTVIDLLVIIDAWGSSNENADVNGNGLVETDDLLAVISAWGPCP
jgi:hypothetical protein